MHSAATATAVSAGPCAPSQTVNPSGWSILPSHASRGGGAYCLHTAAAGWSILPSGASSGVEHIAFRRQQRGGAYCLQTPAAGWSILPSHGSSGVE
eukprot:gene9819-biopygen2208